MLIYKPKIVRIRQFIKLFIPPICYSIARLFVLSKHNRIHIIDQADCKEKCYIYLNEIIRRKQLEFTNLEELAIPINFDYAFSFSLGEIEPLFYGDLYSLQKYAGLPIYNLASNKLSIQHGIKTRIVDIENYQSIDRMLLWSDVIKNNWDCDNPKVQGVAIGAPYFYAQSILSQQEIRKEKERLGHNLLAFPLHSNMCVDSHFDNSAFVDKLKKQKNKFDTIRVCLYWKDILLGRDKIYKDNGFECVCCGHLLDLLFLERQKSLLLIADAVFSNCVGSYVGYAIFHGLPVCIDDDDYCFTNNTAVEDLEKIEESIIRDNNNQIEQPFLNNYDYVITEEQRMIVEKFWGISCIKTQEEIEKLISVSYA